jgi:hypothetical protein
MSDHPTLPSDAATLSIVVPTTGKPKNLFRMLTSLVNGAPPKMLRASELIIYLNVDPSFPVDTAQVDAFIAGIKHHFSSVSMHRSTLFHLTAEQSAFAATALATRDLLWLVGDARSFLPEGLAALAIYVENPTTVCAYFNSIWYDSDGQTAGHSSTLQNASVVATSFKRFVMSSGVNFMATNMGSWVLERKYLDHSIWENVIKTCGPHFSHVTTMLATLQELPIQCHAVYLHVIEAKAYHSGGGDEWARYSRLANVYRFYAWTLGLVRQFQFLVDRGVFSYADIRRSMCSEGPLLRRQVDEIYMHVLSQLRYGWAYENQRFTESEFLEISDFLCKTCPEKVVTNALITQLHRDREQLSDRDFYEIFRKASQTTTTDHRELKFSSLIVSQHGDKYIRLHPRGYVVSPVRDGYRFLLAFHLLDYVNKKTIYVISESEYRSLKTIEKPQLNELIFPVPVSRYATPTPWIRRRTSRIVRWLYRYKVTVAIVAKLPDSIKLNLKSRFL